MYLFILESIGTSELLLIGVIALIVFGPRKLPQMARTIGKTITDFKKTTHEFKSTWEREAESFKEENLIETKVISTSETVGNSDIKITETSIEEKPAINPPQIKELDEEKIKQVFASVKNENSQVTNSPAAEPETAPSDKRNWL